MNESAACVAGTFSSRGDAMQGVSQLIDRAGLELGVPAEALTDLRIALDEIVTNIVKYAYADDGPHQFTIRCELQAGALATIVEDDGVAFDPLRAPEPDLTVPSEQRRVGGLGLHFVKKLMKSVEYERVEGRNRLTLKQQLQQEGSSA